MPALTKSLPPSMVRLCNRLAAEEAKVQTWELCRQLREEYAGRLAGGESMAELEADIQVRVLQAAQEQFNRTMPPKKYPPLGKAPQASQVPWAVKPGVGTNPPPAFGAVGEHRHQP